MSSGDASAERPFPGVAAELRQAIEEKEISVRELARLLGGGDPKRSEIERRNLSRWLAGTTLPTARNARRVAKALGRDPETFLHQRRVAASRLEHLEDRVEELEQRLVAERAAEADLAAAVSVLQELQSQQAAVQRRLAPLSERQDVLLAQLREIAERVSAREASSSHGD